MIRFMLRHISRCTTILAAQRQPLQQPQCHEQNRRNPAYRLIGRQKADSECRCTHHYNRDQEGVLTTYKVSDTSEHQRAERAHQEARRIGGKGRKQRGGLIALRKKQRRKKGRQCGVQIEVVPLEYCAEGRGKYDFLLLWLEVRMIFVDNVGSDSSHVFPPW